MKIFFVDNINEKFECKEVLGFEFGVIGGVEVSGDGLKVKLEVRVSYI